MSVEPEVPVEPEVSVEPEVPVEPEASVEPAVEPEPVVAAGDVEVAGRLEAEADAGPEGEVERQAAAAIGVTSAAVEGDAAEPAETEPAETEPADGEPVVGAAEGSAPSAERESAPAVLPGFAAAGRAPEAPAAEKPQMGDAELRAALEAILLVVDEPTGETMLAQVLEQPVERVLSALVAASEEYTRMGFGFDLRRVAGGWRLYTRPEYAGYVEKFVLDGQQIRLTQAALETLAVIAYKQPVTRSRISAIRGVNCDGVVRTLVLRGLIEEIGSEPESGAFLYRTTTLFLEKLGLNSVEQLPPLAPFLPDDIDEIADAQR
nr:SMC-Scp complex subunit ScpB [Dactylosporangium matsuzakiense]